jgi:hypothetical protein
VNSTVAAVHGNNFAVRVPVDSTTTRLTAVGTTATGLTGSDSVSINVSAVQAPSVTLRASPVNGVAPLTVQFTISSDFVATQVELDANGDGTVDFTGAQMKDQPFTLTQPGVYIATATVTDSQGNRFTANVVVQVYDRQELDARMQAKWASLKDALRAGDINVSLTQIAQSARSRYAEGFQIVSAQLQNIDQILTTISLVEFREDEAIYDATRIDDGLPMAFEVRFVIDGDGVWRLQSF